MFCSTRYSLPLSACTMALSGIVAFTGTPVCRMESFISPNVWRTAITRSSGSMASASLPLVALASVNRSATVVASRSDFCRRMST